METSEVFRILPPRLSPIQIIIARMEILHADEYINCLEAGKKPFLAMAGPYKVTNGFVSQTGRYFLDMGGSMLYEVKPDFQLVVQWDENEGE